MDLKSFVTNLLDRDHDEIPSGMLEVCFEEKYTLRSLDISARVLQNWYENGLLPYDDRQGRKHHFNFVELIWLFIVQELRDLGLPIKSIQKVKAYLFEESSFEEMIELIGPESAVHYFSIFNPLTEEQLEEYIEQTVKKKQGEEQTSNEEKKQFEISKVSNLLHMLTELLLFEMNFFLLIDKDGNCDAFTKSERKQLFNKMAYDSFIILPLAKFFLKYMENIRHISFLRKLGIVNKYEHDILELIRRGEVNALTVRFKNQQPVMLEIDKEMKTKDMGRLMQIISRKKYQNISINTQEGNVTYTMVKTRHKL